MAESCQSGSLHEIAISRVRDLAVSLTWANLSSNCTCASLNAMSVGVRLMNWASHGQLKSI